MVNGCSVSTNSVTRYHLLLGKLGDPHASMQRSTVKKTGTRYTAENSVMSALAFALVTMYTHFIPGETKHFLQNVYPRTLTPETKESVHRLLSINSGLGRTHSDIMRITPQMSDSQTSAGSCLLLLLAVHFKHLSGNTRT